MPSHFQSCQTPVLSSLMITLNITDSNTDPEVLDEMRLHEGMSYITVMMQCHLCFYFLLCHHLCLVIYSQRCRSLLFKTSEMPTKLVKFHFFHTFVHKTADEKKTEFRLTADKKRNKKKTLKTGISVFICIYCLS